MFQFRSHQVHSTLKNGKRVTRKNTVRVNGAKGTKTVEVRAAGAKAHKKTKALTRREISNIKRGTFMPGLFRDCHK